MAVIAPLLWSPALGETHERLRRLLDVPEPEHVRQCQGIPITTDERMVVAARRSRRCARLSARSCDRLCAHALNSTD